MAKFPQDGDTRVEHHPAHQRRNGRADGTLGPAYQVDEFWRAMVYRKGVLNNEGGWAVFPGWNFILDAPTEAEAHAALAELEGSDR